MCQKRKKYGETKKEDTKKNKKCYSSIPYPKNTIWRQQLDNITKCFWVCDLILLIYKERDMV